MTFLNTLITNPSVIIGLLFACVPFALMVIYKQWVAGVLAIIFCVLGAVGFGLTGGIPTILVGGSLMTLLASSVIVSYAYVNKQDPFTSRVALQDISFEETTREMLLRRVANLGDSVRASGNALVRNKAGFLGFCGLLFFVVVTVFGPLFVEYDGKAHMERRTPGSRSLLAPPSEEFPLGLDWQGRDVLSHMVNGGQKLIVTSLVAGLFATILAVILGSIAALLGGVPDQLITALANLILTIPSFPLLLVIASIINFDNNLALAVLFALLNWPVLMRAVRAQVLSLRERDYVEAAIALDLGLWHIVLREVFPNMISYIAVNYIFTVRVAMYSIVGLVFLGLVPLTEPDWGVMIFMGRQQGVLFNPVASGMILSPVIAIAFFQLSLVLFARSLEEVFNPRLRSGL